MGVKRWMRRYVGGQIGFDIIKSIIDEGSLVDGVKRIVEEDIYEDNPVTSMIYKEGKYDGRKDGFKEASNEYEKKLLQQADEFLKKEKIFEDQKEDYEKLLDEYEEEIQMLTEKLERTELENEYLNELILRKRKLLGMAG